MTDKQEWTAYKAFLRRKEIALAKRQAEQKYIEEMNRQANE